MVVIIVITAVHHTALAHGAGCSFGPQDAKISKHTPIGGIVAPAIMNRIVLIAIVIVLSCYAVSGQFGFSQNDPGRIYDPQSWHSSSKVMVTFWQLWSRPVSILPYAMRM